MRSKVAALSFGCCVCFSSRRLYVQPVQRKNFPLGRRNEYLLFIFPGHPALLDEHGNSQNVFVWLLRCVPNWFGEESVSVCACVSCT